MPITKSDLDLELQDLLASTQNIKADANKRIRALNTALDKIQSFANWLFTVRKTTFSYDGDTEEYDIATTLLMTDFKELYTIDKVPIYEYRSNNFGEESASVRMKEGKYYLNCYLNDGQDDTLDLEYFSSYMVKAGTVWQARFSLDVPGEDFIGPIELKPLISEMAYYEILRKAKNIDKTERSEVLANGNRLLNEAYQNYGHKRGKGTKRIKIIR